MTLERLQITEMNFLVRTQVCPEENVIHCFLHELLLLILLQQLADEFLSQLTGVTEELLIELIIYG